MFPIAPELHAAEWLNTAKPLSLQQLRGKVVAIYAFQMLCPGCVSHGIPQAKSIRATFDEKDVAVLGLHSVFEHHAVMNRAALEAFVHEYRIGFPVAIDQPSPHGPIPLTMEEYQLRGTPTLILIDRQGRLRLSHFGRAEDMQVGALIGQLVAEAAPQQAQCDDEACSIR
ncbi:redoxin domain-containing protein [Pseudoduganella sp. FT55W]|uniref:Redoxin domain-containing protein n=1 Tax=Duganella rivi TaxID=2666083 RepID=A0A7X4KB41_9BURK|nr:redoxin domain-containing protein [Duganella rivi]MYM66775.1 redoxin domain-containing protein [Duganella rivi]